MRDPVQIGRCYSLPIRPVRRSLNEGFQGDWTCWGGTRRQLLDLAERTREPESAWWFRYTIAAGIGAVAMLLALTLR